MTTTRPSLYLYERTGGGWTCSSCPLKGPRAEHVCVDEVGLTLHMITHRDNGHLVPEWVQPLIDAHAVAKAARRASAAGPGKNT